MIKTQTGPDFEQFMVTTPAGTRIMVRGLSLFGAEVRKTLMYFSPNLSTLMDCLFLLTFH